MLVSERVLEKEFKAETNKKAYMDCCKWLSSNIIAKNNSENITYRIEKAGKGELKSIKLTVYVCTDLGAVQEKHCNICKEATGAFFMRQNKYQCELCKMLPFIKRLKDKLDVLKANLKEKEII